MLTTFAFYPFTFNFTTMASRLYYIDNLRIFLISLVVLHHLLITYGGPGGWYYQESEAGFPLILPMAMFLAANQSFFMGMFFFISAFFIIPSLHRKGISKFMGERMIRLGIPTVVFYFIISPFAVYILDKFIHMGDTGFLGVLQNGWGRSFGPMWFVEALIIFTSIFLILRKPIERFKMKVPTTSRIIAGAILVATAQYIIRIWLPVGTSHDPTNFQFPFFVQYVFLFFFGLVAWQNKWMDKIDPADSKKWFLFAQLMIFIVFPAIFIAGGAESNGTDAFMGGFTWQCLAYTFWEQITGFALMLGLFGIFKLRFNRQDKVTQKLSSGAYGVYIFHTPVLVGLAALFLNWDAPQLVKFLTLAPLSLIVCFVLALIAKAVPGLSRVL